MDIHKRFLSLFFRFSPQCHFHSDILCFVTFFGKITFYTFLADSVSKLTLYVHYLHWWKNNMLVKLFAVVEIMPQLTSYSHNVWNDINHFYMIKMEMVFDYFTINTWKQFSDMKTNLQGSSNILEEEAFEHTKWYDFSYFMRT